MVIIKLIRNHPNWIRVFAILNSISIMYGFYLVMSGLALIHKRTNLNVSAFVTTMLLLGIIGSAGLWAITTKLIKYKVVIILLYIPSLYLSWIGISFNLWGFEYSEYNEIMTVVNGLIEWFVVVIEIFILICFWGKTQDLR